MEDELLESKMVSMPCFIGGELSMDLYEDMVTYYVQSRLDEYLYDKGICTENESSES